MSGEERLFFEDFRPGDSAAYDGPEVTEAGIVAFAQRYDPQPMHLDGHSAQAAATGGLIASGWHTACLHMRMLADDLLLRAASMGAPGIESLRWLRPVRPGDRLRARRDVLSVRPSTTRADRGAVTFRFTVSNQLDEPVLEQTNTILFGRRQPGTAGAETSARSPKVETPAPAMNIVDGTTFFTRGEPGLAIELGDYLFTRDDIVGFARDYDPQPFHTDEDAAAASHFGGLIASGWQTVCIWMRLMADARRAAMETTGGAVQEFGVSPGFKDLRWLRPVRPGQRLHYRSVITGRRAVASRPGWDLISQTNEARSEDGAQVFANEGVVFVRSRT